MIRHLRKKYIAHDACWIARRAWSMRLMYLAAFLTGLEAIVPFIGMRLPGPEWARALLILAVVASALIARVLTQRKYGAS